MTYPNPERNNDEEFPDFRGSFTKTLPHQPLTGTVSAPTDYNYFRAMLRALDRGEPGNLSGVAQGNPSGTARFVSPLAGASTETHGPDPQALEMRPAPGFTSPSTAAEMVELYWMALLRDKPIAAFLDTSTSGDPDINKAVEDIRKASLEFRVGGFGDVLAGSRGQGRAQPGVANP